MNKEHVKLWDNSNPKNKQWENKILEERFENILLFSIIFFNCMIGVKAIKKKKKKQIYLKHSNII